MIQKPFEIETIARQELRQDRLFPLLTPAQRDFYVAAALAIGEEQAARHAGRELTALVTELGASVRECEGANVVAGISVYAEYDAGTRQITLHRAGIARLAEHAGSALPKADRRQYAHDLLLAHELFHHLEATCVGPVHRMLPPITIPVGGGLWRVQRRVLRTREIAAHRFAHGLLAMTDRSDRG